MPDRKIVHLFPPDDAPDSDERAARARAEAERLDRERRETHIREEVAKIPPLPQGVEALANYGARMARDIRVELVHMRVHGAHARDIQSEETRQLHEKIDWIIGSLGGLGRHVEQHDSVSNEIQLEQAEQAAKLSEAKAAAHEAKTVAVEAKTTADKAWALVGKGGLVTFIGTIAAKIIKDLFF